ncbi:hypothetical protein HDU87_005228 [Geranomyces variabilis]|uniref:N-acetyltransferase domain-containing protein n=1 Tax=Geranomyces variabilis TaxID=109894 RepID=A0AAD5THD5_9FUNG|nr:hypothetical protein HDU87_005228 [Geranomyces variabilis]
MTLPLGFAVRLAASADDFAFIMALLRKEQWNPGTRDAVLFPRIDPEGFFIATLDGKPVGCISALSYAKGGEAPSFGFIGLYIIAPEHRGKRFGVALWNRAMSRFAGHQTIGLDAVAAQVPNYIKSGFVTAYRDVRFMGIEFPAPLLRDSTLVPLDQVPIDDLIEFDARYFCVLRKRFLETWAEQTPEMHGVALLNKAAKGRGLFEIQAYGVIRQGATGYRAGPLFAKDSDAARIVLLQLVHLVRNAAAASPSGSNLDPYSSFPVYLDAPDLNTAAAELMQSLGMKAVSECARMYHGPAPVVDVDGIFATTTDI